MDLYFNVEARLQLGGYHLGGGPRSLVVAYIKGQVKAVGEARLRHQLFSLSHVIGVLDTVLCPEAGQFGYVLEGVGVPGREEGTGDAGAHGGQVGDFLAVQGEVNGLAHPDVVQGGLGRSS